MRDLAIAKVAVRDLRNLHDVEIEPGPRFNVIAGPNGSGKTSLLEALYAVATSKSFRASRPGDLVTHGAEVASVRARVLEAGDAREQSVGLKQGARAVRVDGKRPSTLAAFATATPMVVFHPGELALSMGSGAERRRLLDRVALYVIPSSLADAESYARAVRERQRALATRGASAKDLGEWEELIVRHGLALMDARERAVSEVVPRALEAFTRIGAPGVTLRASYRATAPREASAYLRELARLRVADERRGAASIGPHRDDLVLDLGDHTARGVASQGQHRAIVLALKSGEVEAVGTVRGVRPILLLDDVSSELDRDRMAALLSFLGEQRGQVFLTTTRPELIEDEALGDKSLRVDFAVFEGKVEQAQLRR